MTLETQCATTLPETSNLAKTLWILGCALSSIVYGILLVLAHSCFTALRKRKHRNLYVHRGLIVYVFLVVVGGTAVEVIDIKQTLYGVLNGTCTGAYLHVLHPYAGPNDILTFLMTLLTDGVLLWRCYAVTKGSMEGHWFILSWLIPLLVYVAMIGASITLAVGICTLPKSQKLLAILFPLQLGASVLLNMLITSIIVALLFRHRRRMIETFGSEQQLPLLNIMTILTESATLIVFADIVMIVTVCLSKSSSGDMVAQIQTLVQPVASLLIVDRVSRGTDYFSRKEEREETSQLTTLRFSHSLPGTSFPPSIGELSGAFAAKV